jgi:hypothetical protein
MEHPFDHIFSVMLRVSEARNIYVLVMKQESTLNSLRNYVKAPKCFCYLLRRVRLVSKQFYESYCSICFII